MSLIPALIPAFLPYFFSVDTDPHPGRTLAVTECLLWFDIHCTNLKAKDEHLLTIDRSPEGANSWLVPDCQERRHDGVFKPPMARPPAAALFTVTEKYPWDSDFM